MADQNKSQKNTDRNRLEQYISKKALNYLETAVAEESQRKKIRKQAAAARRMQALQKPVYYVLVILLIAFYLVPGIVKRETVWDASLLPIGTMFLFLAAFVLLMFVGYPALMRKCNRDWVDYLFWFSCLSDEQIQDGITWTILTKQQKLRFKQLQKQTKKAIDMAQKAHKREMQRKGAAFLWTSLYGKEEPSEKEFQAELIRNPMAFTELDKVCILQRMEMGQTDDTIMNEGYYLPEYVAQVREAKKEKDKC